MHPHSTPQTTVSPYKIISENTRLAELRFCPLPPINRLKTPTKLVLNRAFQIATNKILSGWKLRCSPRGERLPAAGKANGLAPCVEEKRCANGDLHSQQVHEVTAEAQRAPKMSTD